MLQQRDVTQTHSAQEIADMVDKSALQWVDQFNTNLNLTVRAVQRLRLAFDGKFTRL